MRKQPIEDRLWPKLREDEAGCWVWTGHTIWSGYGRISFERRHLYVHRVAYELVVGLIPPGLELDHLCKNRACANPAHLEPVTRRENLRRSDATCAVNARRTHCKYGHPLSGENLYVFPNGRRRCRTCQRERARRYKLKMSQPSGRFPR